MPESMQLNSNEQRNRYEQTARDALREVTPEWTIGAHSGETDEGNGAVSVLFDCAMPGYPGWKWTVSIAEVDGEPPTVLEAELMPGDGALLAPDWVPWSDRLADYKAAQELPDGMTSDLDAAAAAVSPDDDDLDDDYDPDDDDPDDDDDVDEDDPDDEDDDLDDDDVDDDDEALLHSGDLDGVDIDALDDDALDNDALDDDDLDEESDGREREKTY